METCLGTPFLKALATNMRAIGESKEMMGLAAFVEMGNTSIDRVAAALKKVYFQRCAVMDVLESWLERENVR